jgi:hypothetical protein
MVQTIRLLAMVDENHRLVIDLPDDIPTGPVELVITAVKTQNGEPVPAETQELTREEAWRKLIAAGLVSPEEDYTPDALEVTEEELERLARSFATERPISELIDEDREDRI